MVVSKWKIILYYIMIVNYIAEGNWFKQNATYVSKRKKLYVGM